MGRFDAYIWGKNLTIFMQIKLLVQLQTPNQRY